MCRMNKSYNEEKENSCMHDFQYDRFIQISLLFVSRKQNENKSELETLFEEECDSTGVSDRTF